MMDSFNQNINSIIYNDESTMPDISDSSDSPSLPSLSLNSHMNRNGPQISPKSFNISNATNDSIVPNNGNHQMMTMREYDTKLNELKRENFNLKLRIYILEKGKSGAAQPECESAIAKELLKREKTIRAYHKIVDEKDDIFKETKLKYESQLREKDLVIDELMSEKETLTNELTENSNVCRLLMAHLNEFVEFWKRYLPSDTNDANDMMASLLNSSEDLLNSASVLITNDGNESLRNRSMFGMDLRNNTQMSGTGMSSLGLLTDMSELMSKTTARASGSPKVSLVGKAIQTELTTITLNNILSSYYEYVNKNIVHSQTQTDSTLLSNKSSETQTVAKQMNDSSTQTNFIISGDKAIATDFITLCQSSTQSDENVGHNKGVQCESRELFVNDSQNKYSFVDNNGLSTDEDRDKFIPVRPKPKSLSPNSKKCQNSDERHSSNTLYTYKASLSPIKPNSRSKTKESDVTDNVETSLDGHSHSANNDDHVFKVPNDDLIYNRSKKQIVCKLNEMNKTNNNTNKIFISSRLSSSSSSLEGSNRVPPNGSLLQLDVNCLNKNNANADHLSSPDLGIGDSDFDLVNIGQKGVGLRVYASVGLFKLLKEQINEAICSVNTIDRLNQDFNLNIIDYHEFVSNFKPKLTTINQSLICSRNICRKFVIEDNEDLVKRLEKMRISKEKMEKAITKQLHKTDILLKKAKVNLKEN